MVAAAQGGCRGASRQPDRLAHSARCGPSSRHSVQRSYRPMHPFPPVVPYRLVGMACVPQFNIRQVLLSSGTAAGGGTVGTAVSSQLPLSCEHGGSRRRPCRVRQAAYPDRLVHRSVPPRWSSGTHGPRCVPAHGSPRPWRPAAQPSCRGSDEDASITAPRRSAGPAIRRVPPPLSATSIVFAGRPLQAGSSTFAPSVVHGSRTLSATASVGRMSMVSTLVPTVSPSIAGRGGADRVEEGGGRVARVWPRREEPLGKRRRAAAPRRRTRGWQCAARRGARTLSSCWPVVPPSSSASARAGGRGRWISRYSLAGDGLAEAFEQAFEVSHSRRVRSTKSSGSGCFRSPLSSRWPAWRSFPPSP